VRFTVVSDDEDRGSFVGDVDGNEAERKDKQAERKDT
jgi:hypothetical protein